MDIRTLWITLFICIAIMLYSVSDKKWNLLTLAIVLAFCSGLALYFKLMGGAAIL